MAASPVTGERPTGFRRSSSQFASLPQRNLSFHEKVGLAKDDAAADVLYTHPSVRIYTFQPPTDALNSLDKTKKTLPDADYPIDAIEILPWRARTETLAARGKLIIEKVQGSVHFLKAGDLIHTIMKNSQCWCVDGESKFVMRVGRLRYQRIEMPNTNPEEKQKVEEFKEVIGKILKFEKTPCPFIRGFHVDLPEDAITPRRRGTWRRKESLSAITTEDEPRPARRTKTARTMSMRAMPPSSFPSRSLTQLDMERPRTASTPTAGGRFSFPDVRVESPTTYTSGDDNTDSDRHDSESDRPDTGHSSEFDESDRESGSLPINRSRLNLVQTLSPVVDQETFKAQELFQPPEKATETVDRSAEEMPQTSLRQHRFDRFGEQLQKSGIVKETTTKFEPSVKNEPSPRNTSNNLDLAKVNGDIPISEPEPARLIATDLSMETLSTDLQPTPSTGLELPNEGAVPGVGNNHTALQSDDVAAVAPNFAVAQESPRAAVDVASVEQEDVKEDSIADVPESSKIIPQNQQEVKAVEAGLSEPSREESLTPEPELTRSVTNDDMESTISADSFHTSISDDEPMGLRSTGLGTRPFQHRRELSEMTVTAESPNEHGEGLLSQTDGVVEHAANNDVTDFSEQDTTWPEMHTPGAFTDGTEIRQRLKHRRSLSPLPPASILQTSNHVGQSSPIPAELLQKAATLAVVKPLEVIIFVMQVLSRIAGGATMNDLVSGDLFRRPGVRRTASGTFEQNLRGPPAMRDSDEEDDYGVPVSGRRKSSNKEGEKSGFTLDHEIDDSASFASID